MNNQNEFKFIRSKAMTAESQSKMLKSNPIRVGPGSTGFPSPNGAVFISDMVGEPVFCRSATCRKARARFSAIPSMKETWRSEGCGKKARS